MCTKSNAVTKLRRRLAEAVREIKYDLHNP